MCYAETVLTLPIYHIAASSEEEAKEEKEEKKRVLTRKVCITLQLLTALTLCMAEAVTLHFTFQRTC